MFSFIEAILREAASDVFFVTYLQNLVEISSGLDIKMLWMLRSVLSAQYLFTEKFHHLILSCDRNKYFTCISCCVIYQALSYALFDPNNKCHRRNILSYL